MGNDTRDTRAGISYGDVGELLRRIGAEHSGRAHFDINLPVRSGLGPLLEVRCSFRRPSGRPGTWVDCAGVSGRWPSGQSLSFAGLLFRLAYELLGKLDEEVAEAERAARAQMRLL